MASLERLQKSLDVLKALSSTNQPCDPAKKKEKVHHCYLVADAFSNPTIKISPNVSMLLEITISTFLRLCDDTNSDVRMTSDECLNRIIRAISDGHITKIQIELLKEIKKNGSPRSLRAAIQRFSQLVHHIKPHKGKPYVVNLFPRLITIADRNEESIHDTLATCLPNIFKSLLIFTSENDIKALLKSFLHNVVNPSATIRRSSSSCLLSICIYSRRTSYFVAYCTNTVLDKIIPVDSNHSSCVILGIFYCLKGLLPHLNKTDSGGFRSEKLGTPKSGEILQTVATNKLLQIYEVCIYYLNSDDHNIVNASLDLLTVLLNNASKELKSKLTNPTGINACRIHKSLSISNVRSPSQLSVLTGDDHQFQECDLTETIESDIDNWIGQSKLYVLNMPSLSQGIDKLDSRLDLSDALEGSSETLVQYYENPEKFNDTSSIKSSSFNDNPDAFSDRLSERSETASEHKVLLTDQASDFYEVDIGDYIDKSVPLLYCSRLLAKLFLLSGTPGQCLNDRTVRVSVKCSALTCISSIFQLYPYAFFIYLDKNYCPESQDQSHISSQRLSDIILLKDHSDPQLRGLIGGVLSSLLKAMLEKTNCDLSLWSKLLEENLVTHTFAGPSLVKDFVQIWIEGLKDENANCLRQTLLSLKPALHLISESSSSQAILPLLDILPTLSNNPYWLVKVALCELISSLSYLTIYHNTGNSLFQQKVLCKVLLELLKDPDQRVRSSASIALLSMIEQFYCEDYHPNEMVATTKGIYYNRRYLPQTWDRKGEENVYWEHFVQNMPLPYSVMSHEPLSYLDYPLSKVVARLYVLLLESSNKYCIYGCIEALAALSNKFPCTIYKIAWGTVSNSSMMDSTKDLLNLCIGLLTSTAHAYDISFLTNLMNLTFNLYAGFATSLMKPIDIAEEPTKNWAMFSSESLKNISDQYLLHTMRLLNVVHRVINDIVPLSPQSKTVLQHIPSAGALSPIKRRKNDDRKLATLGHGKNPDKDEIKGERKMVGFGHFSTSQHYVKIYDTLRSAFVNYKISLDPTASESFIELIRIILHTTCVIMEVGTLHEFGKIAEEVLTYLKSTFQLDKTLTVKCVQQLLKCLFETNLTANFGEVLQKQQQFTNKEENHSFYHNIFQKPCEALSAWIQSLSNISKVECDGDDTIMGYLHRKGAQKHTSLSKSLDKTLASYIRIFEPIVIHSLKQYTMTSDVMFQCQVLQLLCQLVQLRINYCLLDSDQVFKDYVLKQFEYIEEGLVEHSEEIIPKIFHFLVNLSYSKQHSKSIIDIPKIIQLCDGLMASGQDPETHCIPALEPIVEDVFLFRSRTNTTDVKELETTREVILSMLLRLLEYPSVIDLVTLILDDSKYCIDDTEKWLRWSGQVAGVFLQLLSQDKIRIKNSDNFVSLRKLIFALNPNVFRPADSVILMLFQAPPETRDVHSLSRWLSKAILLFFIISPLKEDDLLEKMNTIKAEFNPNSIFENFVATADPLNVYNNADAFKDLEPEAILSRLILRIINLVSSEIVNEGPNCDAFLVSQLSVFLMYCSHIFQTGSLCKVSQLTTSLLQQSSDFNRATSENFIKVRRTHPILSFHYCHILSVLNYGSINFWSQILNPSDSSVNASLVQVGGTIVFCDYLSENISETKQLSWILTEHSDKLVKLLDEIPVSEFISFVHRNSTLSKAFLAGIGQHCLTNQDPVYKTRILKCVENCHPSQTGTVIKLLIPKLLFNRQTAVTRLVVNLASRKIEFLLTMNSDEVFEHISKDELFIIKEELRISSFAKKHETLISLLNKLSVRHYDTSPIEVSQAQVFKPESIRKLDINKKWLLSQIQAKYQDGMLCKETSKVMARLAYSELSAFLASEDFNKAILKNCIERGVKMLQEEHLEEEPPILKVAVDRVLKEVSRMVNELCCNHEIFTIESNQLTNKYTSEIVQTFENATFPLLLQDVSISLSSLMKHLPKFPTLELSEIDSENISKFAVLALEFVYFSLSNEKRGVDVSLLELLLDCSDKVLKQAQFCNYLGVDANLTWLCSAINSLYFFTTFLLKNDLSLPSLEYNLLQPASDQETVCQARKSCHYLYVLTSWCYQIQNKAVGLPQFLTRRIKNIIISLSRLPLVNSYNLVPLKVWKLGWQPVLTGKFLTQVPPLPIDMLQEIDVLQEYIFRTTLLGWTTRQQFEETWMSFLSVLCAPLDNLDAADIGLVLRASCLAIKAITAQLLQTLRCPVLGNKNVSDMMHVPRNTPISVSSISLKKLQIIQDHIENKFLDVGECSSQQVRNVFANINFEKLSDNYSYGQLSIKYFLVSTSDPEENSDSFAEAMNRKRKSLLNECGLDVNSCLQFLLDYYSQLLKPNSAVTDIRTLHETVRSILYISDLFTDKAQFGWMLDTFLNLAKVHAVEDELVHQYLIVGICKAVGVLTPDLEIYEQTKKLVVQFLKSPFLPTRISCLYGLLYVLEGCLLSNISIGGISEELQLILPCACEYLQVNLATNNSILTQSKEHATVMWSMAFYIMENVDEVHMEANFISTTLLTALTRVQTRECSDYVDRCIIKGLERLLLVRPMYMLEKVGKHLQKLALDKMKHENLFFSILGVQLLVTYMYVDCWEHLEKPGAELEQSSPDHLVQTIEKISATFERIKKSFDTEVQVLSSVLPLILKDFFSPSDILTKVIGEFLSPQQPHPKLMSGVVFRVFDSAIQLNQLSLLQDWVVFSLSSFTQSFSNMATWCLTCFFISASPNEWLKAYFPYVQARVGRYECEDRRIFCIAGADFYKNLTSDHQRKTFVDSFMKVRDHPDMPFSDLLSSL